MEQPVTEEAVLPRLLASNALRANLSKHMTLNQMADQKASMIMTAASLMLTISVRRPRKPILTSRSMTCLTPPSPEEFGGSFVKIYLSS